MEWLLIVSDARSYRCNSPAQLRILGDETNRIKVELHQSIVHGSLVPVVRDSFPSLVVGEIAVFSLNGKEALDYILGCSGVSQ